MKKVLSSLMVFVFVAIGGIGFAEEPDTAIATVTVPDTYILSVGNANLVLELTAVLSGDYEAATDTGRFVLTHNRAASQKISAKIEEASGQPSNNIEIKIQVEGSSELTLSDTDQVVGSWSAGYHDLEISWTANASLSATHFIEGGYTFTVTFTAEDDPELP